MHVIFSDEYDKLTPEMWNLMERAADIALMTEFSELKSVELENEPELGVTVVDDSEILELNREYREKDSVTDVLSFPQFDGHEELLEDLLDDEAETLIGDVVICFEQAERQAKEYGTGLTREMLYLFVHSVMHLFGYDHMDEEEKAVMRTREEEVLSAIGVKRNK
ncbi:MAG: rRNA maturation RNase YbeY [Mogibacterium sp.]|nr:rRNA maturation RNase YbeY [Mogibacterium sp.]MBQ6499953.1 rRNA maturation RNase YbeY [Mogibacterium sp.]